VTEWNPVADGVSTDLVNAIANLREAVSEAEDALENGELDERYRQYVVATRAALDEYDAAGEQET